MNGPNSRVMTIIAAVLRMIDTTIQWRRVSRIISVNTRTAPISAKNSTVKRTSRIPDQIMNGNINTIEDSAIVASRHCLRANSLSTRSRCCWRLRRNLARRLEHERGHQLCRLTMRGIEREGSTRGLHRRGRGRRHRARRAPPRTVRWLAACAARGRGRRRENAGCHRRESALDGRSAGFAESAA